ncbi:hypothetical protein [Massilia antarctica]|uniref:hypothetical protein n=1 Tax=Massilia antarctica TaxID=2765360 RepID=UPI00227110FF|nr:hypothetical protein [Massilia sp. H27-R4]MCY0910311.1 hypothetical protein [Massilia sp. H27-R4]
MNDVCDADDFEEMLDYSKLSDEEVHGKLIWFWFRFFRLNENFEQYCEARRIGDELTRSRLETQFQRIEDLYKDWGDIHILPEMYGDDLIEWKEWLATKNRLFFTPKIRIISSHTDGAEAGTVMVSIPIGVTRSQLSKLFDELIEKNPEILGTGPKYLPAQINGQRQGEILTRLEKAELVSDLISGEEEFKYSHAEIAELVLKVPSLREFGFKWYPTADQAARIEKGTFQKSEVNDYKRTIVNLDKFFKNTVEGTIHGTFPASL